MPCPSWPCADCTAAPNLFDIINAAIGLLNVPPSQQDIKDAIVKAAACGKHLNSYSTAGPKTSATTLAMHVLRTQNARTRALNGQWQMCINELDHAGGGGPGKPSKKKAGSQSKAKAKRKRK